MVSASLPKFLRNGDNIQIPVTIKTNLALDLSGQATLQLTDPVKKTSVDGWFNNVFPVQYFTASSETPAKLHFLLTVPDSFKTSAQLHIISTSGLMSDTMQKIVPVFYHDHNIATTKKDFDVKKMLYKKSGKIITAVTGSTDVFAGDTLVVKLIVTSAKSYAGVTLTDPLAATMKTFHLPSNYKLTGADVVIPIQNLQKGQRFFSYPVIAEHAGRFSFAPVIIKAGAVTESFDPGFILRVEPKE